MKIRIIGYAGSGKTSLTSRLQTQYNTQGISLDDYLKIKNKEHRQSALNDRLNALNSWVVEGVQVSQWTIESIKEADIIVVLDYPLVISQFRVTKRAFQQFFDFNRPWSQRKRVFKRMFKLYKWNRRFKKRLPTIKTSLYKQSAKLIILESPKDEDRLHKEIKSYIRHHPQKKSRRKKIKKKTK